jgi:hypothetical protein
MSNKGSKQKSSPHGKSRGSGNHGNGHGPSSGANHHVIPGHNAGNHSNNHATAAAANKRSSATYGAAASVAVDILPPSTASVLLDNARSAQAAARFDHSRTLPLMIKKAERYRDITCPRKKITVC